MTGLNAEDTELVLAGHNSCPPQINLRYRYIDMALHMGNLQLLPSLYYSAICSRWWLKSYSGAQQLASGHYGLQAECVWSACTSLWLSG